MEGHLLACIWLSECASMMCCDCSSAYNDGSQWSSLLSFSEGQCSSISLSNDWCSWYLSEKDLIFRLICSSPAWKWKKRDIKKGKLWTACSTWSILLKSVNLLSSSSIFFHCFLALVSILPIWCLEERMDEKGFHYLPKLASGFSFLDSFSCFIVTSIRL